MTAPTRLTAWLQRWVNEHAADGPDDPLLLVVEPFGDGIQDAIPEREKPDFVKEDDKGWVKPR